MTTTVVWVTGASGGIGAAIAKVFAEANASVVLSARRSDKLEQVKASLPNSGKHMVLPLDMTCPETFEQAVNAVRDRYGHLDVLVNNAGMTQRSRVMEASIEVDRRIMELDFFGVIGLTRQVLPWMKQQGTGQLVVISSLVGEIPTPKRSAYSAAKHALHGWFEALRAEEGDWLRILMVLPGFVRTQVSVNALAGDGSAHGSMDELQEGGMEASVCAERIYKAVQQNRAQVIIAGREKVGVYLKRWCPPLYRYVIRRIKVT